MGIDGTSSRVLDCIVLLIVQCLSEEGCLFPRFPVFTMSLCMGSTSLRTGSTSLVTGSTSLVGQHSFAHGLHFFAQGQHLFGHGEQLFGHGQHVSAHGQHFFAPRQHFFAHVVRTTKNPRFCTKKPPGGFFSIIGGVLGGGFFSTFRGVFYYI